MPGTFKRVRDIVPDELELRVPEQVGDVLGRAGDEVIDRDDLVALGEEPIAEVRPDEPGSAGDERAHKAPLPNAADVSE